MDRREQEHPTAAGSVADAADSPEAGSGAGWVACSEVAGGTAALEVTVAGLVEGSAAHSEEGSAEGLEAPLAAMRPAAGSAEAPAVKRVAG